MTRPQNQTLIRHFINTLLLYHTGQAQFYMFQDGDDIVKQAISAPYLTQRISRPNTAMIRMDSLSGTLYRLDSSRTTILAEPAELDGESSVALVEVRAAGGITDFQVDGWNGRIYWIDSSTNQIHFKSLGGTTSASVLYRGLRSPNKMALALDTRQVFWSGGDQIFQGALDEKLYVTLPEKLTATPTSMEYDPVSQRLFLVLPVEGGTGSKVIAVDVANKEQSEIFLHPHTITDFVPLTRNTFMFSDKEVSICVPHVW